jgi:protein-arginine kinase activator protein McsA
MSKVLTVRTLRKGRNSYCSSCKKKFKIGDLFVRCAGFYWKHLSCIPKGTPESRNSRGVMDATLPEDELRRLLHSEAFEESVIRNEIPWLREHKMHYHS